MKKQKAARNYRTAFRRYPHHFYKSNLFMRGEIEFGSNSKKIIYNVILKTN